jgi:hypothetical protein
MMSDRSKRKFARKYLEMIKHCITAFLAGLILVTVVSAQKAEVTVILNEAFFDSLLDSIYTNYDPPEFSVAQSKGGDGDVLLNSDSGPSDRGLAFDGPTDPKAGERPVCSETVKIIREMNGVRTSVRFRDGKIYVPLAFTGNYNPPFVGCVEFGGWSETNIDLEFDEAGQRLIGRARVLNVNLNGTGGVGGTLIAKLIQGSIDKKLNPIEIMRLDKVSFGVPIQNAGNIRMKAVSVRPEITSGSLQIHVIYDFLKG